MLDALGFSVLSASSGAQAVTLFEQQCDRISVVLLDMTMPGMNGIDTLARLRAVRPDVRAILSTGYDEHTTMSELADQRPVGFLKKPYTVSALSAAVQGVLSAEQ